MLASPRAQEFVFDSHHKKISTFIESMLAKATAEPAQQQPNANSALLETFNQALKAPELPRDLLSLKEKAKILLNKLNPEKNTSDFILAFADYLDHELTAMECYVSKAEELTQNYLREKRGWHDQATRLVPLLAACRAKNDLNFLKSTLLEFCNNQLVYMGRQSRTFKPNLEAIANAIHTRESELAASPALTSQAVKSLCEHLQSLNRQLKFLMDRCVTLELESEKASKSHAGEVQALRQLLQKEEAAAASSSLQLDQMTKQVAALKLQKAEAAGEQAAQRTPKKEVGFFENLFGGSGDAEDSPPPAAPILNAHKAAKTSAGRGAPAKVPATNSPSVAPAALRMEEKRGGVAQAKK